MTLQPEAPFIWPEPRILEALCAYERHPPFADLALTSSSMFGTVTALTGKGVELLSGWLERKHDLKIRLIVSVYPTCSTRQSDLSRLLALVCRTPDRLAIRVRPLERITDRATNALCFLASDANAVYIVTGPSDDLGLARQTPGQTNFVFRADPALVEAFKRYFDWLWFTSREISSHGVAQIPGLDLPSGSEEGARLWEAYVQICAHSRSVNEDHPDTIVFVDPKTGEVTIKSLDGELAAAPTEEIGLAKLDPLAERIARLYGKGELVSIDKQSRIPPLNAPLKPSMFGDVSEFQKGAVIRKVSIRVSIIDEKTLKEIDKRRKSVRTLLEKFTFGLANNMRWMPNAARELFASELNRISEEGKKLISDLLKGDVDGYIDANRETVVTDINAMFTTLGRPGKVTKDVVDQVVQNLKDRLQKAQSASFMPKLTYSVVSFSRTDNAFATPWGQAYSLLADIAAFPRKAMTNSYFFCGLKISDDDLIEGMNVADDALLGHLRTRGIKDRCESELNLLSRIEKAPMESRERCEFVRRILDDDKIEAMDAEIKKKESG